MPAPAQRTQQWRARTKQEPEIVPVATACLVVERELFPPAEHMHDEDDPGRQAVPDAPQQVLPPHHELPLSFLPYCTPPRSHLTRSRNHALTTDALTLRRG